MGISESDDGLDELWITVSSLSAVRWYVAVDRHRGTECARAGGHSATENTEWRRPGHAGPGHGNGCGQGML